MNALIVVTYLIYVIFWESLVIGGGAYLVFCKDQSPWWMLLACVLGGSAFKPSRWRELISERKTKAAKESK